MRSCIFCDSKKLSIEDVWPLWLMRHFPPSETSTMSSECGKKNYGTRSIKKPKLTLRRICTICNNGWMSALEARVMPIIISLLHDKLFLIEPEIQLEIAQWAVKTAMVLESIDTEKTLFYTNDERRNMSKFLTIPPHTQVWIAKCVNHQGIYSVGKNLRSDKIDALITTMAFKSFSIQILSFSSQPEISNEIEFTFDVIEGPWDQTIKQIYPHKMSSFSWPLGFGLDGEIGLEAFANRIMIQNVKI